MCKSEDGKGTLVAENKLRAWIDGSHDLFELV